ncbi:hypothetical protein [Ornithinimicrobium sp. CNJ-824]|uniref:hypothetical protein n=1 Tax=Ornithinimicrobium sp. CNJ-824 TaxID=1904966 RepID=UPI00117C69E0|nr:hypothetical protein [Ornithinimicrobium sp. CNJ-824]
MSGSTVDVLERERAAETASLHALSRSARAADVRRSRALSDYHETVHEAHRLRAAARTLPGAAAAALVVEAEDLEQDAREHQQAAATAGEEAREAHEHIARAQARVAELDAALARFSLRRP